MTAEKVLLYIENNDIQVLTDLLKKEIYEKSLSRTGGSSDRYKAMKRSCKALAREEKGNRALCRPFFTSDNRIAFCDGYSLAITSEKHDSIEMLEQYDPDIKPIDILKIVKYADCHYQSEVAPDEWIALAKQNGYKYTINGNTDFLIEYNGIYFNPILLDRMYPIISDGGSCSVYYDNPKSPIYFVNNIGVAMVLPVNVGASVNSTKKVIKVS